ncbi:phasin family protein [Massilia sp. CMS3.1]|uniref:phasin family protein n=1 Tax=Massilia sp. CMS3.1 TaxID=3373083 RepID=UPI003EE4EB4D
MFLFSHSDKPAVRAHLSAQTAFLNDMSKSLSRSFQEMCQLNIQLGQTLLEEGTIVGQQLLTANRPADLISMTAARAQPASEKLRAYQQHLSRVAADSQVEFSKVTEQHVQQTSRTARALAEQVANSATEETDRTVRQHEESLKSFRDPFDHNNAQRGNGRAHQGSMQASHGDSGGNMQMNAEREQSSLKDDPQGTHASQVSQQAKPVRSS